MIMVFNILNAGESGIAPKMVKENNNIIIDEKTELSNKIVNECKIGNDTNNPFSKNLSSSLQKRLSNGICFYPIDTLRVVGIVKKQDNNIQNNNSKNKNNNKFKKNLALVQVPNNKDQVIVYEGQQIGKEGGFIKEINLSGIIVQLDDKLIKLDVMQ